MSGTLRSWLLAFRLKTLPAAVAPVISATALAHLLNFKIETSTVIYLLMATLCLQIATNLFNDAIDFKKGADHHRIGPQRVTQSGLLSPKTVQWMAVSFCGLTMLASVPIVWLGGWPILLLGLISLFLTYGYTGGPYPLAYLGLGDLFVILFFGLIAVGGSFFVLTGEWGVEALVLGLQMGFLSTILIAINNLRDSATDILVHKKTLAVRFGDSFVKKEIFILSVLPFLGLLYWFLRFDKFSFALPLVCTPLAFSLALSVLKNTDKKQLNACLAKGGLLLIGFALTFSLACWL